MLQDLEGTARAFLVQQESESGVRLRTSEEPGRQPAAQKIRLRLKTRRREAKFLPPSLEVGEVHVRREVLLTEPLVNLQPRETQVSAIGAQRALRTPPVQRGHGVAVIHGQEPPRAPGSRPRAEPALVAQVGFDAPSETVLGRQRGGVGQRMFPGHRNFLRMHLVVGPGDPHF